MKALARTSMLLAALPAGVCFAAVPSSGAVHRFALVVGANRGAADRVPLRYAVADAERFAKVVTQMGGVRPADCIVLHDPTRQALFDALAATRARAISAKSEAARIEVLVYFSGHADDQGLMLGREVVAYRELRSAVGGISADVGITILDACGSGAITRLKGGQPHPAFLTDASSQIQGYAFLTSSSENEAAQEAERLQGSFFTHALITGLRGAADVSGDGKVTLGEAYQFAFAETLAETTSTQAGAQHPAYDIKMAGTGDVVMTDVRETSASLILGSEYDGRFLVLDAHRRLIAELYKPQGRRVELGLEPGKYQVYFQQERALLEAPLDLADGQRQELIRGELRPTRRRPTQRRGPGPLEAEQRDLLAGRWRLGLLGGLTGGGVRIDHEGVSVGGTTSGLILSRWAREDLAVDFRLMAVDVGVATTRDTVRIGGAWGYLIGARYYPPMRGSLRPHFGGALGPFRQGDSTTTVGANEITLGGTELGGILGGGADVLVGRHLTIGLDGQLALRASQPSRFDVLFGLGWRFGGGKRQ